MRKQKEKRTPTAAPERPGKALQPALQPVMVAGLDPYISAAYSLPVLSAEEEHAMAVRYHKNNDLLAAETLVKHNLRHVVYIARGYSGYGLPLADLVQEGAVGLMKAVKRYNPDRKVRLISFAMHAIRAEIHEFIIKNWRIVKVATTKAQRKLFFKLRGMKSSQGAMSGAETRSIAKRLDVDYDNVVEMEKRMGGSDVPFDPYEDDDDKAQAMAVSNTLAAIGADPAQTEESADWDAYRHGRLCMAVEELDERSRDIIKARRMSENKATLQELADKYGVSVERIRQIEGEAIKRLRDTVADCRDDEPDTVHVPACATVTV